MKVLAIGSHPDDIELGCGGTLARHVVEDDAEVVMLVLSAGGTSRIDMKPGYPDRLREAAERSAYRLGARVHIHTFPDQRFDTVPFLDIIREIEATVREEQPEVVYTHSSTDLNLDHVLTMRAVMTALRPKAGCPVRRILSFEIPSSTEWSESAFWPTVFSPLDQQHVGAKLDALRCFSEELPSWPHPRSIEGIRSLLRWRGATVGADAAEAFALVREMA